MTRFFSTVEIPVYWEQFEPRQGRYDTGVVDILKAMDVRSSASSPW
jgi:beta-galactosidase GanA